MAHRGNTNSLPDSAILPLPGGIDIVETKKLCDTCCMAAFFNILQRVKIINVLLGVVQAKY